MTMEYLLVQQRGSSPGNKPSEEFIKKVNEAMKDGWETNGPHVITFLGHDVLYSQSMIRTKESGLAHKLAK